MASVLTFNINAEPRLIGCARLLLRSNSSTGPTHRFCGFLWLSWSWFLEKQTLRAPGTESWRQIQSVTFWRRTLSTSRSVFPSLVHKILNSLVWWKKQQPAVFWLIHSIRVQEKAAFICEVRALSPVTRRKPGLNWPFKDEQMVKVITKDAVNERVCVCLFFKR